MGSCEEGRGREEVDWRIVACGHGLTELGL